MRVYIFGITGGVGSLLVGQLRRRGHEVGGLVREPSSREQLALLGVAADLGQLSELSVADLRRLLTGTDVIVFAAGSNGGAREMTDAIDVEALARVADAAAETGSVRFILLSVMPEAWRERTLSDDEEYYFAMKKFADVALVRTALQWTIVRPSLLTDDPPTGTVSLSSAELHESVSRSDVAATLAAIVDEPRLVRRIVELNRGTRPIPDAVADAVAS